MVPRESQFKNRWLCCYQHRGSKQPEETSRAFNLGVFLVFLFQISNFEKLVPEETKSTSDGLDFQSQIFTQAMSPLPHKNELMSTNQCV